MYPIIILSFTGLLTLFLGLSSLRKYVLTFTIFSLFLAAISLFLDWNLPGVYFFDMVNIDNKTILVELVLLVTTILVSGISNVGFLEENENNPEYYALIQFTLVGALLMVSFQNYLMLFVGLEILSVGLYVLAGTDKRNLRGNEASIKYFLMGAFATGILLYGIAMYYGATQSFKLEAGFSVSNKLLESKVFFYIGMAFILVGILFKISAAPFHFWAADVYQGSPSVFTAYMATIVKTAGIFTLLKILLVSFGGEYAVWSKILLLVGAASMIIGNVAAVYQTNFKRMLAFSGISQAGFMILSIIGANKLSYGNLAFYSLSYGLATICAFGVFMIVSADQLENGRSREDVGVFKGLFTRSPFLAIVLLVSMLSLSGIPLTSGFWSKFFVLNDAASRGYVWILIVGILMSAVSLYYYFKPIRESFSDNDNLIVSYRISNLVKFSLGISAGLTILLGIAPNFFRGLI